MQNGLEVQLTANQHLDIVLLLEEILLLGGVKKENAVARSSSEAEFRPVVHGICEVLRIKRI